MVLRGQRRRIARITYSWGGGRGRDCCCDLRALSPGVTMSSRLHAKRKEGVQQRLPRRTKEVVFGSITISTCPRSRLDTKCHLLPPSLPTSPNKRHPPASLHPEVSCHTPKRLARSVSPFPPSLSISLSTSSPPSPSPTLPFTHTPLHPSALICSSLPLLERLGSQSPRPLRPHALPSPSHPPPLPPTRCLHPRGGRQLVDIQPNLSLLTRHLKSPSSPTHSARTPPRPHTRVSFLPPRLKAERALSTLPPPTSRNSPPEGG